MNEILQDIETAELHTYNTIKIISNLQDTITKLSQDDDPSSIELSQFEKEAEYLKKLAEKIANDLIPPVPNSSSISLATKFIKTKSKSNAFDKSPKFIKAKPKKTMSEKSQQTCDLKTSRVHQICDKKVSKAQQDVIKNKVDSVKSPHKKHKSKKDVEPVELEPRVTFSNIVIQKEHSLQPTKYLQHILIPIGKVNFKNLSTRSIPNKLQHNVSNFNYKKEYCEGLIQSTHFKQDVIRTSGVEQFAKMMQLCMDVKENRESDLEKQIYILEEEMQAVVESNNNLYNALEMLEEHQNATKMLINDCPGNTLMDKEIIMPELALDKPLNPTSEQITNELTEDIIKCIQSDIQEISSNIAKTKNKLIFKEPDEFGKPKFEFVKHVLFLEDTIVSMENKLETAQGKQVELAIQSKAVVEAAHRMTNESWTY